jgi:hypothetical protein
MTLRQDYQAEDGHTNVLDFLLGHHDRALAEIGLWTGLRCFFYLLTIAIVVQRN